MTSDEIVRKKFKDLRLDKNFILDLFWEKSSKEINLKSSDCVQKEFIFYLSDFAIFYESFQFNIGGLNIEN